MPKVYAFDVDDTLQVAGGPIPLEALEQLRKEGHIVGLCGNVHAFTSRVDKWWDLISFTLIFDGSPLGWPSKHRQLTLFRLLTHKKADAYVLVGNIKDVSGASDDKTAADLSGWTFIKESDFVAGVR